MEPKQVDLKVTAVMEEILDVGVQSGGTVCKGVEYTALGDSGV